MTNRTSATNQEPDRPSDGRSHRPNHNPTRMVQHQSNRRQDWGIKSAQEILAQHPPGKSDPLAVLEVLLELFNTRHTALNKTVSHKTRHERALFLRRFFRDLKRQAGFDTVPDPRNLGQRHIQAMVAIWQRDALAPATIQTYLSFLRGLASWLGKAGFIREPAYYGLLPAEYQRHENATHDKSWSAQGIDAAAMIERICAFDIHVGASLRLMHAFGLRRRESVQVRPYDHVRPFEHTGLDEQHKESDNYLWVKGKGGRVRWLAISTIAQRDAIDFAQSLVRTRTAPIGHPDRDLRANLRRLDYALARFGLTRAQLGVTAHGLRHQVLNDAYETHSGAPSPVRGGGTVAIAIDKAARYKVSEAAGHARLRAAGAYVGSRPRQQPTSDLTTGTSRDTPDESETKPEHSGSQST